MSPDVRSAAFFPALAGEQEETADQSLHVTCAQIDGLQAMRIKELVTLTENLILFGGYGGGSLEYSQESPFQPEILH